MNKVEVESWDKKDEVTPKSKKKSKKKETKEPKNESQSTTKVRNLLLTS
jgi:hypothetical protein